MTKGAIHDDFNHYLKCFIKNAEGAFSEDTQATSGWAIASALLSLTIQINRSFPPPDNFPKGPQ